MASASVPARRGGRGLRSRRRMGLGLRLWRRDLSSWLRLRRWVRSDLWDCLFVGCGEVEIKSRRCRHTEHFHVGRRGDDITNPQPHLRGHTSSSTLSSIKHIWRHSPRQPLRHTSLTHHALDIHFKFSNPATRLHRAPGRRAQPCGI